MNKQPLSTLPMCLFHPNTLRKSKCLPERKVLMRGDFLPLLAACSAQGFVPPPAMARLSEG